MPVVVITPPNPIVTSDMAKAHLRIDGDDEDDLLDLYIDAAQGMIDGPYGWLGRCIGQQTLELCLPGFSGSPVWGWSAGPSGLLWGDQPSMGGFGRVSSRLALPFPPLISVTSVIYEDSNGNDVVLPSADYLASDDGIDAAFGGSFPDGRWAPDALRIQYVAGYATVPRTIVAAMLLMIGDLYSNRETVETGVRAAAVVVPMSMTVEALLAPYRVFG